MKQILLITLLLLSFCFAQFDNAFRNFSYSRLDTVMSRLDTNATGLVVKDLSIDSLLSLTVQSINIDTSNEGGSAHGKIYWDKDHLTASVGTGIDGVSVQLGQELMTLVYNNSGALIENGKFVFASGVHAGGEAYTIGLADASSFFTSGQILGALTHDCQDESFCFATYEGDVHDVNTSGLSSIGPIYLGTNGDATNTQPLYPNRRIILGGVKRTDADSGIVFLRITQIQRNNISKSYTFTSQGIGSGTYWKAGYYDFNTTSEVLTEANTSVQYGTEGAARGAHFSIVASGPGSSVGGVVGLRVNGVCDFEDGSPQAVCLDTIVDDITTMVANTYYETPGKFSSDPTLETFTFSGSPTTWSTEVNYGFAKYDDLQDRDYTITGFECVWQGNANNNELDIELLHHSSTGWTFASSNFIPGNGSIAKKSNSQQLAGNVWNGIDGAWKRSDLNFYIAGQTGEGHVVKITTSGTSTVQIKDCHMKAVSEELDF